MKVQACSQTWDLLTKVYGLPKEWLYLTYFGGQEAAGLERDEECRDIWLSLGLVSTGISDYDWG